MNQTRNGVKRLLFPTLNGQRSRHPGDRRDRRSHIRECDGTGQKLIIHKGFFQLGCMWNHARIRVKLSLFRVGSLFTRRIFRLPPPALRHYVFHQHLYHGRLGICTYQTPTDQTVSHRCRDKGSLICGLRRAFVSAISRYSEIHELTLSRPGQSKPLQLWTNIFFKTFINHPASGPAVAARSPSMLEEPADVWPEFRASFGGLSYYARPFRPAWGIGSPARLRKSAQSFLPRPSSRNEWNVLRQRKLHTS